VAGSYLIYDMWQSNQEPQDDTNQNVATTNTNTNANRNTNRNVNRNTNTNTNVNDNTNVNTNDNANDNTNVNANANDNTNTNDNANTNANENDNVNQLIPPIISGDADRDGLTDLEEALVGSSASSPDTDQDGYLDGAEVLAGYNPVVSSLEGGLIRLKDSSSIDKLITSFPENNFSTLYIKGWSINKIEALHEVRITTATGEMITISMIDNEDGVSAANYYLSGNTQVTLSQLNDVGTDTLAGVYAPNGLSAYLTDENRERIYIFEYDLDDRDEFRYPTIFHMIIENFEFFEGQIETDQGSGTNASDGSATTTATSTST
jgi:hypothetical protein